MSCILLHIESAGQDSSALIVSGYCELYYGFDFDLPQTHEKAFFLYNHKRHNEVNVNLAYAKANYTSAKLRGNLAIMTGTYAQYNLAAEPEMLRFIYEANMGVKLSSKRNIWLDAGIMPSHIGFESAVAAGCWTPSRSMIAENSPYYETGIKLTSTTKNTDLFISFLVVNGWQKIQRPAGINYPCFGMQLNYRLPDKLTLNYSNFIGTDKPDTSKALRTYHNFYAIYQLNKNWGLTGSFDIGRDKNGSHKYEWWYSPVIIVRRVVTSSSFLAFRSEFFNDSRQVLLITNTPNGFKTIGISLNYDYWIAKNAVVRVEGKGFFSKDKIFKQNQEQNNYSILLSFSMEF